MANDNDNWFTTGDDDLHIDEDLGVPKPPDIFKTNVAFLRNKRLVLLFVFIIIATPVCLTLIDVHRDGPTFVDLDITQFRLEKVNPLNGDSSDGIFAGLFRETKNKRTDKKQIKNITFGLTSCGEGVLENSVTSIKSMIIAAMNYGVKFLDARIFVESLNRMDDMSIILEEIKDEIPSSASLKFVYEIYVVEQVIPRGEYSYLWIELYKQCAAVHLFIEKAVQDVGEILFLDADTLVLGDLREVWSYFEEMDKNQFMGLTLEQGFSGFPSFYEKHSRIPFVPPTGVSTGVMLLNLTRLRQYDWEVKLTNVLRSFAHDLLRGDQDIINALFYFNRGSILFNLSLFNHALNLMESINKSFGYLFIFVICTEYLKVIPCIFNFRRSNCKVEQHCREASTHPDGIQILHGNSKTFEAGGEFREIYTVYRKFNLKSGNFKKNIVNRIMKYYENLRNSRTVFNSGCIAVGRQIFNRWWNHNTRNRMNDGQKKEL
ncbi:unnamed protein product [Orchesella dallaii]|uniref:UDP-D-xylose:beta-D-glucoside alpha-1,3-D-xylosyltransferase n=1 Tax=Orchesella dallaii TaxID=48710 RepID=A0ABP1Q9T1_9HEXA